MRLVADLHVHSRYSRAVSRDMTLATMAAWAKRKGIDVIGTGDFTHPAWFASLENELEQAPGGLAVLKGTQGPHFLPTVELACIYRQGDKTRRIHLVILAPTLATVRDINARLTKIGNLRADGRPILGTSAMDIARLVRETDPRALVIPAHIWTPWFSLFGSMSGFDSIAECFGDEAPYIRAVETGLSSDPPMNWRLSQLDQIQIVSFSDAHSAPKLGREATLFEVSDPTYDALHRALTAPTKAERVAGTIEFFPEEGKYHWDGHRSCGVRWAPEETKRHQGLCPKCKRPVTVGVLNRNEKLADHPLGYQPTTRPPFHSLVPLQEIIADAYAVGVQSKKVQSAYDEALAALGTELHTLLEVTPDELRAGTDPRIAEGILRVRERRLEILPGFDGEYGTVRVFGDHAAVPPAQSRLF